MRSISPFVLVSFMAGAGALAFVPPSVARADGEACTAKKFEFKKVEDACKKGGRDAVKELMKAAVKKAKDAGKDVKCKNCHEDLKAYDLKSNAVDDLKPWI
jgi:hypothetical protein